MVSSEHIKALYVAIPLYIVMLVASAYWAHTRMEKMTSTGTTDHISAHYLGGRSFGPLVTAGTIFASLFSGYTAIGIPNEAYNKGWTALRWMPTTAAIVMGYFGTALRLRKLSLIRNHQSPVDFITDRYQSQVLRYTMLFSQTVPAVIYVSAQVISLKSTFNSMFEIDPDSPVAVIIMMIMILLFEWAGGLSSVAMTDCIQGFIMVISFIALPSVIKSNFGGWKDFDPATFPKPDFYQTPDKDSQWDFWQFSLLNFSFFTLPHFVQRIYAARDLKSLKFGFSVITVAPWLTMFTGVFMGTVGVQILGGEARSSPFSDILEAIMDVGGFPKGVAVIAFTASLAALMSTADSLIIAISQLITAEVIYPARPNSTPKEITIAGRFVSLCTVGLALAIGLSWDEGITDLGNIQFPLSLMAVPTFIWGLFATSPQNDVHPWCLAAGDMVASIYIFFIYFLFIDKNSDPAPINAGTTGMCIHLFVTLSLEAGRRVMSTQASGLEQAVVKEGPVEESENEIALQYERPDWDVPHLRRFGEKPLSHELVWKAMEGVREPLTNIWYAAGMFVLISVVTPLVPENEPPLDSDNNFVFPPAVINGMPWWAFKITLLSAIPYVFLLGAVYKMPTEYPFNENKIEKEGVDPDLVELTPHEMGRRMSYDSRNDLVYKRRSTIKTSLVAFGLVLDELDEENESPAEPKLDEKKAFESVLHTIRGDDDLEEEEEEEANDEKGEQEEVKDDE